MKKLTAIICCLLLAAVSVSAQTDNIEKIQDFMDGKVSITNAKKLFSGCDMRLCYYEDAKTHQATYGVELDMKDHVSTSVGKGDLLIISFKDGSTIRLSNLFDTQAEIQTESHVESFQNTHTDFIPVYSRSYQAFFAVPVTRSSTNYVPVTTNTSFVDLYYVITPEQIQQIIEGEVREVTIVTDTNNIVRKAKPLSKHMAALYKAIQK